MKSAQTSYYRHRLYGLVGGADHGPYARTKLRPSQRAVVCSRGAVQRLRCSFNVCGSWLRHRHARFAAYCHLSAGHASAKLLVLETRARRSAAYNCRGHNGWRRRVVAQYTMSNLASEGRWFSDAPCRRVQLWTITPHLRRTTCTGLDVPLP